MRGEKLILCVIRFDFKSRQTNKTNKRCMVKKHNKKKGGKEAESARASRGVHVMFCAV